jgi:hypothetical protein
MGTFAGTVYPSAGGIATAPRGFLAVPSASASTPRALVMRGTGSVVRYARVRALGASTEDNSKTIPRVRLGGSPTVTGLVVAVYLAPVYWRRRRHNDEFFTS